MINLLTSRSIFLSSNLFVPLDVFYTAINYVLKWVFFRAVMQARAARAQKILALNGAIWHTLLNLALYLRNFFSNFIS